MITFTEESTVEDFIVKKLQKKGWLNIKSEDLERDSYKEPLLLKNLIKKIKEINNLPLDEGDLNKIVTEIKFRSSEIQGIKDILLFLKLGVAIKLEKTHELKYVSLIDFKHPEKNEYIISRQVIYEGPKGKRKPDIMLYINGIPLVIIECKSQTNPSVNWRDAYNQIKQEYEKDIPELFKYVQIGVTAEDDARYFPIVPWLDNVHVYMWRWKEFDVLEATLEMFSPEILLDLIKNYIFIREFKSQTTKVLPRYMQYRAANKIYTRVVENIQHIREEDIINSGLIWHWQGSGKTLTMIFAAHKLYREPLLENPTILFVIDRKELEEQMFIELTSLDFGFKPEVISSIEEMKKILKHDAGKGKRGFFITLIHKFRPKAFKELEDWLKSLDGETILERKNIICFIDEGHRTQYGTLAAQMRRIFKNAFFFAFTGTPIAKKGRDTYKWFTSEEELYLDKYFILDSIKDGFTLPIRFQLRLEKGVHLDKENLEDFLDSEFEEIPDEYEEDVQEGIKRRLNLVKVFLKDPERVQMVANDIKNHFVENLDGKFKALVVAVDREACVMYKEQFDKLLPTEYTEVIMTLSEKEKKKKIGIYANKLKKKLTGKTFKDFRKEKVFAFKNEDFPKILIVTDMLLTGFDEPLLQTMYLDKPLKEHRLLQAVARVNRPYKDFKDIGLILDYIGIFKNFEKAVEIYMDEDINRAALDLAEDRKLFLELLNEIMELFKGIDITKNDRETLNEAIKRIIKDKETTKLFEEKLKDMRKKFELLGPDPFKLEFLESFKWIVQVYYAYRRRVKREDPELDHLIGKYFARTLNYIHKNIDVEKINEDFPILTMDENYLEKLEGKYPDTENRVSDIVFTLKRYTLVERGKNPIIESISERVERILIQREELKKSAEEVYKELRDVILELVESKKRQIELDLEEVEYNSLLVLEEWLGRSEELVNEIKHIFNEIAPQMFKGWSLQKSVTKNIGQLVRRKLRKFKFKQEELNEIYDKIMGILKKFD